MFKAATDKHGRVDVLVNNVGWDNLMFFTQTTPDFWRKVIDINYVGVLNCTKTALDLMVKQNGGAIVSISSDASRQGEPREAVGDARDGQPDQAVGPHLEEHGCEQHRPGRRGRRVGGREPGVQGEDGNLDGEPGHEQAGDEQLAVG